MKTVSLAIRSRCLLLWMVGAAMLASGSAQALTLHDLKDEYVGNLYGTYAPHGDCQRQPRIGMDDSGFTFKVDGETTHPRKFVYSASFFAGAGRRTSEREASLFAFFPFAVSDDDLGPLQMTVDSSKHTLTMERAYTMVGNKNVIAPTTAMQAALIAHSPYVRCKGTAPTPHPAKPVKPAPAKPRVALDWDNLPAMLGKYQSDFELFGAGPIAASLKRLLGNQLDTLRRNLDVAGPLSREGKVYYLSGNAPHQGGEDMAYVLIDASRHAVQVGLWEHGKLRTYALPGKAIKPPTPIRKLLHDNPSEEAVAAPGVPWQTRAIAGRPPLALALAAASTDVKSLSVFCDHDRPLLALLLQRAPRSMPLTFTLVFRGGLVDLPMTRGNRDATLWLADLSGSLLPRMLSSQGGVAYLRLNGRMQGEVSMQGAAAASQAALADCRRR